MNHSYDHKFKANGELAKQTGALLNIALNSMPPNQLNSLAEDYLNQVEAIDLSASLYSEERSKNDAIKQKVAESILYLKKHQHISNPRFLPTEGNIAGWCVELANSSCSDSISLFGENAYLDEEQSQTGGYSLIVGKPNIEATVKTTLQTVPGQTYTLSFDMTGNFVKYHTFSYTYQPVYAVVDIGGEKVELNKQHPLVEIDYWIRGNFGHVYAPWDNQENGRKHWEKVELQFVASQQQTTLSFTHKAQTELGQKTSPLMLSNVMVFDDVTADKELSPGKVALIASSTVTVVGAGATLVYLAKKGIIQNVFAKLGLTSTTVGPGTRTMAITTAFDDMYEIMQGSGGRQVIENYLAYPTFEYGAEYFHNPITPSDLDLMADMGFREVATGMSANQLQFEDSATYITKTVSLSTPIEEQTVIKFGSQEQAANFARQLDSYLLREEIAIPGIHQYVNSISVMIGNEEANASVAEHESVIILHSAAEFDVGGVVQIGVTEFISRFAMLRGFDQYIVDSLPFTYNPTSLSGIGWSSIAEDVNLAASTVIHSAYQEGMTVEEFSTAAMEALELAGVVALL
ncbi:hypothetical protein AND4_02078 [Vibrio sp. AND4]|nr:hypothetical protein AND4_02078 [Vibrio sp. AND4]